MTTPMKLFVFLWLIMLTRVAGAILGGRQCLKLRHITTYRQLYEWLTILGVAMVARGISDLCSVFNQVVNGPPNREQYPSHFLWGQLTFQLLQTGAVWLITLVFLDGDAPGFIRKSVFWVLTKIHVMDFADPKEDPRPNLPEHHITEQ